MIVIFEGLDNVGKSTQIQEIRKRINKQFHLMHYSAIKGLSSEDCLQYSKKLYKEGFQLIEHYLSTGKSLIMDRFHLGEYVYSPIYRDYSGEYIFELEQDFKKVINSDEVFLIVLIDSAENCIARDDGLSHSTDIDKKNIEINSFKLAYRKSHFKNKMILDIANLNVEQVTEIIMKGLQNDISRF